MGEQTPNPTRPVPHPEEDLIPPDPLLDSNTFIHIDDDDVIPLQTHKPDSGGDVITPNNPTPLKPHESDLDDDVSITNPTPLKTIRPGSDSKGSKSKRQPEEMAERPEWLPLDWRIEVRMRTSGATAGSYDRYYISPSGRKFRSKTEVLHFLETGSTKKRKADADGMPPASSKNQKDKKPKRKRGDFSGVDFDYRNPPQNVTWTLTNASHDIWTPAVDEGVTPEHVKRTWDTAFSCITELEVKK
ncbi:hypothetical protein Leryth_008508 [Lithospermum erythrorhizon]|nr:hypothetical protein Leryth_008508 [Lithospermum erythrorhizon]